MYYILNHAVSFSGIGIHSGVKVDLTVSPGSPETGIRFFRTVQGQTYCIPADARVAMSAARATVLEQEGVRIRTPEHLLSALYGLGIVCADITISDEEVPILDGSAQGFVTAFLAVGLTPVVYTPMGIETPLCVSGHNGSTVSILPDTVRRFTFLLQFPNSIVGYQYYSVVLTPETYSAEVAGARTFGFVHEIEALKARGLALGGTLDNAIVIGETSYLTPLRFPDELARHKVLDLIGDMALVGVPFLGHVIGVVSGHALHAEAARTLLNTPQMKLHMVGLNAMGHQGA